MAKEAKELAQADEMHLDDFLGHMAAAGKLELAAAFALYAKAKGMVKAALADFEKEFETFSNSTPK